MLMMLKGEDVAGWSVEAWTSLFKSLPDGCDGVSIETGGWGPRECEDAMRELRKTFPDIPIEFPYLN